VINPAFSYIQLSRHGKIPTRDWKGDPRALVADVREWVAQEYNLGVRTDRTSGVWVLDVDVDVETLQPTPEWQALLAENGLPPTYTVRTPSGGIHYYFRFPDVDVRNDQGKVIAEGVDIRGIGGYVVAADMFAEYDKHGKHFAGTYDVIDDSPIAQTPDWIAERFRAREDEKVARAERVNSGVVMPKAASIDAEWDNFAKGELNSLFAKVEELRNLPEGESIEILGEQRGWERGAGFFTLACKIIEVARWPHTSVTVEEAHKVWASRVPAKYAQHDWANALESAGPTWAWGEQQRNPVDLFAGVAYRGNPDAPEEGAADEKWEPLDISDKPTGWAIPLVFKVKKDDPDGDPSGAFMVETARRIIDRIGPIAADPTGFLWTYDRGVYVIDDDIVLKRLYHMIGNRFTSSILTNVKLAVRAKAPLLDLTRPPSPGVMNFTNGTLEWRHTDEVQPHDPKMLETTQFPYAWKPDATCPRFDNWLETMLEPDQVTLAWKILGYMMLSGNPLQIAVMLYGKGSNGKSTFAHVIERLVGVNNTSAVPLKDFNERFATSAMIGKIANIVGDIDFDYQVSTAAIKQATGADAMQFERKNRDAFRAVLWATNLFSANRIPATNDGSEGYAERWIPMHFKRKASEHRIEGFSEEALWEEIPGIAAKAVRVLRTLPLHQGASRAAAFDLTSDSAVEAVEEFREASNAYYAWVKNHTVPSETEVMKPKELWQAYRVATGVRHGGTNCPPQFAEVLTAAYGDPKMMRGLFLGVQRNVRGYKVTVVDDDDASANEADFFQAGPVGSQVGVDIFADVPEG
jgi:P4 family phage/plasmid primase-like protien